MKIKCVCLLFFLTFVFVVPVNANSFVWKISKGKYHLFLGGTIHFLNQADYPLPPAFEKAYNNSGQVVFETDLQKLKSPEFQIIFMSKMAYADNRNVKQFLKPETFQALENHLTDRGIPVDSILKLKPGMISMMLTIIELQRLGLAGTGVDEFFNMRASKEKKQIGQLETAVEQLTFLSQMGVGKEDEFINYTLRDLKELPALMNSLKDSWKKGDNNKLQEMAIAPLKNDFPELYKKLIVERNNDWVPKIEELLKTGDVEFVLVGSLHLVGDDGLLTLLKKRGYKIQRQ